MNHVPADPSAAPEPIPSRISHKKAPCFFPEPRETEMRKDMTDLIYEKIFSNIIGTVLHEGSAFFSFTGTEGNLSFL
jgi:hypothetical protein